MNNRGQAIFFKFMLGITIIILILAIAPAIREQTDDARSSENMDCGNASISDFDKVACISADLNLFLFVGIALFIGIAVFIIRRLTLRWTREELHKQLE